MLNKPNYGFILVYNHIVSKMRIAGDDMLKTMFYVRYIGNNGGVSLVNGQVYSVVEKEDESLYRIVDETECDYLFCLDYFKVLVEDEIIEIERKRAENRVEECNRKIVKFSRRNF